MQKIISPQLGVAFSIYSSPLLHWVDTVFVKTNVDPWFCGKLTKFTKFHPCHFTTSITLCSWLDFHFVLKIAGVSKKFRIPHDMTCGVVFTGFALCLKA